MKSKRRKIFYVALSILIAATIWFYVNNKESVTVYVHDVPIEFLNEDTSLADKGLMRISGAEDITVDLKLQMPRNVVYDFDTSELRLVSDLSTITYAGKQSVSYTILYPSKVSSSSVKVESPTIRTVQVEIGELNKKDIEIRCKVVGNVAEGYIAGTVEMLPETLEVRGQQADIMQISYAQVTLDIENASSTVVELLDYELYDFNDQLIESKNIHPMSENVQVTMPVLKVKDVPLTVNFIESAGSRLENYTYTLSHSSVTLSGDATQMAGISEISLGTLALEDVHGRLNEENIFEKLAAHARVDDRARAGDVVQRHFTLEDDENARARFGHFRAGEHRLRDGVFNGRDLLRAREGVERAPAARAELIDEAADLGLEEHDERQRTERENMAQKEVNSVE